ncbi:hypothetical protein GIB67_034621 [Kingdonia uniflora]|uniref:O-methyltransferase dimerisation domain-containing protein n=1 Tax=Kingdonia uniflora TaxID=39325 RepID=A0A7J7MXI4_9MAGN|nr:hypothetical protein GIB67_034621 [Kingdonia uniflora]
MAIELDVLEIVAKAGPGAHIDPSEIAFKLPTTRTQTLILYMLDRMLRLLASYKVCTLDDGRVERVLYGLAPVGQFMVKNEDGVSFFGFFRAHDSKQGLDGKLL